MDMPNSTITPLHATPANACPPVRISERLRLSWSQLSSLVLSDDIRQRATITVLLMTLLFTAVLIYVLYYGLDQNIFDEGPLPAIATVWLGSIIVFYAIVRTGLNQRLADKTMAMQQTCVAQTFAVAAYGYTGTVHSAMLVTMALIMAFGMFNMKERPTCISCLYSIALLGAMMAYKSGTDPLHYPPHIEWIYFTITTATMLLISGLSVRMCQMRRRLRQKKNALELAYRQEQELSTRDELTGLPNRRNLKNLLEQHVQLHERTGQNFYLAMVDLDHFKRINDTWGHHVGDHVLKSMASYTCALLRRTDTIGRWGGEEFLLLLPETGKDAVPLGLGRLQLRVSGMAMSLEPQLFMTFSAGLTRYRSGETIEQTLRRVDALLYEAKARGRNRIVNDDATPGL